jgi:3-dehydroquinate dehydratase I
MGKERTFMNKPFLIRKTLFGGSKPRVAAIIDRAMSLTDVKGLVRRGADLLEIRLDLFSGPAEETLGYVAEVRNAVGVPLLGTVRETAKNRKARVEIFRLLVQLVDIVDIEIDAPIRGAVIAMARKARTTVIVSEHDFAKTPSDTRLMSIAREAKKAGADIVKIAAMARSADDTARMLGFCRRCPTPAIAIAMGDYGTISRVLAPLFGSLVTYGSVGKAVAPGQLPLDDLVSELRRYYPAFAKRR